jgi:hypothetical protein
MRVELNSLHHGRVIVLTSNEGDDLLVTNRAHCRAIGRHAGLEQVPNFIDKATDLLELRVHLLIIDPFPPGPRDPNGVLIDIIKPIPPEGKFVEQYTEVAHPR